MELKDYLKLNKITVLSFAEKLGVTRQHIDGILNKKRWASKKMAAMIIQECNSEVTLEDLNRGKPSDIICPTCKRKHTIRMMKRNSN